MLELVIVRHGESVRNHASDLAHHGDRALLEYQLKFDRDESGWDLTQRGIQQAKEAGAWIRSNIGSTFDAKFVSPFKRARQTAYNLGLRGNHWMVDERLQERNWGDYEAPGQPPYTVEQYLGDLCMCGIVDWKREFPGAESIEDMIPRCASFMHDLLLKHREGRVVLVTHGGTMKSLQLVIERLSVAEAGKLASRHLTNCSVLQYQLTDISADATSWKGEVRFSCPALPDHPTSEWEDLAGLTLVRA